MYDESVRADYRTGIVRAAVRILHITPYGGDAWAYGGIPRVVHSLARGLARRGHEVTVCTTDACDAEARLPAAPPGAADDDGIAMRVFPNVSNRLAYRLQLFLPRGLGAYLRRTAGSYDVGHLHACRNVPGVIGAYHLSRAGVPYILAPNGTAPIIERRRLAKRAFDAAAGRRVLDRAARVLAVSEAERRQLGALGVPAASIALVPNPMELTEFDPPVPTGAFRARLALAHEPLVLFLGMLGPRKRLDIVVRAFAQLERTDARLVIAGSDMGSGADTRALARRLGVAQRVAFTGLLRGRARLEALADASVVVYPSEHEVFGLVALEALLAGTPVIVAGDSGCGEIVRMTRGGATVAVGQVGALAAAITEMLAEPDRWRDAVLAAQPRIREWFGADAVCGRLEAVYQDMAASA
jgi:glycosyltransferase involved in cell wall biosynthesis